jgi:hypothetical protein
MTVEQLALCTRVREIDSSPVRWVVTVMNAFVQAWGGWLTRVPGAHEVTVECLQGSSFPNDLRALGYDVITAGVGERVLPHQIVQRFVRRADGELEPLTAGSTKPVAETRTQAGIVRVRKFAFDMS